MSDFLEKVNEALARTKPKGSRSHTSTKNQHALGEALADTSGFDTCDLMVAILEVEGLGSDLDERRKIAKAIAWPVSDALHTKEREGRKAGFNECKARVSRRLFS